MLLHFIQSFYLVQVQRPTLFGVWRSRHAATGPIELEKKGWGEGTGGEGEEGGVHRQEVTSLHNRKCKKLWRWCLLRAHSTITLTMHPVLMVVIWYLLCSSNYSIYEEKYAQWEHEIWFHQREQCFPNNIVVMVASGPFFVGGSLGRGPMGGEDTHLVFFFFFNSVLYVKRDLWT